MGMFIDAKALIAVTLSIGISLIIYFNVKDRKEKLILISNLAQIMIVIFTLIYMTIVLKRLDDISKLSMHLGLFINSNLYIAIFAFGVRIYNRIKKL